MSCNMCFWKVRTGPLAKPFGKSFGKNAHQRQESGNPCKCKAMLSRLSWVAGAEASQTQTCPSRNIETAMSFWHTPIHPSHREYQDHEENS